MRRAGVELADILEAHIGDYKKTRNLSMEQAKAVYDILSCRTPYLGGHVETCTDCGHDRELLNSCGNRHCPKCQCITKERWLEKRRQEILPVVYFHNVFTLPHEINPVILCNKRVMLNMLFQAASGTLLDFGHDPRNRLQGRIGFMAFLHTWDQKLLAHFHLHCLIPGGALADDGVRWQPSPKGYLFPEKALSIVFRAKFMELLEKAYDQGKLVFPGKAKMYGIRAGFRNLCRKLWGKHWVVKIKDPIEKPEYVLDYIGRYTHRVAISNNRIQSLANGRVRFSYKNRKTRQSETETIDATEFIRRFLQHVLPDGFMRMRYYGFMANRCKKENLRQCRELLDAPANAPVESKSVRDMMLQLTGKDIDKCRKCGSSRFRVARVILKRSGINPFYIIHPPGFDDTG